VSSRRGKVATESNVRLSAQRLYSASARAVSRLIIVTPSFDVPASPPKIPERIPLVAFTF